MGFALNGRCYETFSEAVEAFVITFPSIDTGGQLVLNSYTPNPTTSQVSYNATLRYWDSGSDTRSASFTFYSCANSTEMTLQEVFALPSVETMGEAWGIGFALPFSLALLVWGIRKVISLLDAK